MIHAYAIVGKIRLGEIHRRQDHRPCRLRLSLNLSKLTSPPCRLKNFTKVGLIDWLDPENRKSLLKFPVMIRRYS